MFPGSKVSNDNAFWPCIGLTALNVNSSGGFGGKRLVMPERKPQNQFTGDGLQGSVPSSPGSDIEEDAYTSLDMETREIIDTFLKNFTGLSHSKIGKKQVLSTMKRVVESLVVKHEIAYKGNLMSSCFILACSALFPFRFVSQCLVVDKNRLKLKSLMAASPSTHAPGLAGCSTLCHVLSHLWLRSVL